METRMLFRPSFCAHCGEKVERAEWGLLTSRRFCQVCESEFKGHDLLPRVLVGLGFFGGILGLGGFLDGGPVDEKGGSRQAQLATQRGWPPPATPGTNLSRPDATTTGPVNAPSPAPPRSETSTRSGEVLNVGPLKSDPVYFCGAETRRGTPCSRRVKGRTRCFQHAGMPPMATPERLSSR